MAFPITLLYAGILGAFMALLSIRVPLRRGALDMPVGDGGDEDLATRIRAFGNFTEYVPMVLVLMLLLEASGAASGALHGLGGTLVAARVVHAFWLRMRMSLSLPEKLGRAAGAMLTWMVVVVSSGYALALAL